MKITDGKQAENQSEAARIARTKGVSRQEQNENRSHVAGEDESAKVRLSEVGKSIRSGLEELTSGPQVRADLVELFRTKIAAGSYKPSSLDVASKLTEEIGSIIQDYNSTKVEEIK